MKDTYEIYNVCPFCTTTHFVKVSKAEYHRWRYGELIQNAMPSLSPIERDQLITGACPDCLKMALGITKNNPHFFNLSIDFLIL